MTLIKRSNDLLPTFFDDFFGRDWFLNNDLNQTNTLPAVNIIDNADNFEVEMVAPGLEKKHFKVELDNQLLTISYEKNDSSEKNEKNYTKREFSYTSFQRSFTLPQIVESDKIKAKYNDGLLTVLIPKKEEAKQRPSRMISIS